MPNALVPLASFTLTSNQTSVVFAGIPSNGFRDLRLVCSVMHNSTNAKQSLIYPNGDSGNASLVYMDGSGSAGTSGTATTLSMYYITSGTSTSTAVATTIDIFDHSQTDKHKSMLVRAGSSYNPVSAYAMRWASTAAITSLTITPTAGSGDLLAGSTFNLFGVIG